MAEESWFQIGIVVLVLVIFTVVYEFFVEVIYKVFLKYHIPPVFLGALFRELTLLGLISFILLIIENLDFMNTHSIHSVHYTLFLVSITYITIVALLLIQSVIWSNYLKFLEYNAENKSRISIIARKFFSFITFGDYHSIRKDFVQFNSLEDNFPFYKYVRAATQQTILETIHLDAKIWLSIEIIFLACFLIDIILGRFDLSEIVYLIFISEWILAGFSLLLIRKIRWVTKKLAEYHTPEDTMIYSMKKKRSFIDQQRKTFCPCTLPPPSYISELFWWNSKGLFRRIIQVMLLYQALALSIIILSSVRFFSNSIIFASILYILVLIPLIWILFFAVPFTLPIYSMVAYTSQYSSKNLIDYVLAERAQKKKKNDAKFGIFSTDSDDDDRDSSSSLDELYIPPTLEKPFLS